MRLDGWPGRRVLVTGHTGFKGSWLVALLHRLGAEVHGLALAPPEHGIYRAANISPLLETSAEIDIRDPRGLSNAVRRVAPEVVLHLAAQPLVRLSYAEPLETYATNVMGTVHLLEAVRWAPAVRACVIVTSDKCYDNREWDWAYRECEAMGGRDPYSSSKGCAELVTAAYRQSFFAEPDAARIASARAGNVIGGGDWSADRLVPDLVRAFTAGERTQIRNPAAIRPWQHVLDPLMGYILLANHLLGQDGARFAEGWNFGPDASSERTVDDVVRAVAEQWGNGAAWRLDDARPHPHEAGFLKLDSARAKSLLGWRPILAFDAAIGKTVDWYKGEQEGRDMREFTLDQVDWHIARSITAMEMPA